jgi:hypothetical protein
MAFAVLLFAQLGKILCLVKINSCKEGLNDFF